MTRPSSLRIVAFLTLLLAPWTAHAVTVDLTVTNELDVPRVGAPLQVGLPFGPGELSSVDLLRVDGPSGPAAPLQATTIVTWYDGSPRWVLFEFPVDAGANSTVVYTVSDGGGAGSSSPLVATDDGSSITVETGVLRFTVDKGAFNVLDTAAVDSDGDGSYDLTLLDAGASAGLVLRDQSGTDRTAAAQTPSVAEIEDLGPQSVTLHFAGEIAGLGSPLPMRYVARITAWAGRSDVRVQTTVHNPNKGDIGYGSTGSIFFQDARIELDTALGAATARVGGELGSTPSDRALGAGDRLYLHQDSSGLSTWDRYASRKSVSFRGWRAAVGAPGSEAPFASGNQAEGWLHLGSSGGVSVGIRDFWQEFPNALSARGDGRLAAHFFSEWQSGDHSIRAGDQKTHFVHFDFGGSAAAAQNEMVSAMSPLMGLAPPEYYLSTKSFRRTAVASGSPSPEYEQNQRATLYGGEGWRANEAKASLEGNITTDDVFGWWDYGDLYADYEHNGDRANWENDFLYGAILQMVRSQNLDWWKYILPGGRHLADLDIYHTQEDLGWRNGGFFTHDRTGSGRHRNQFPTPGHYNAQGMFYYYYLTGDKVVRDAALEVATNSEWRVDNDGNGGYSQTEDDFEIRAPGWLFNVMCEAYKFTKQQKYLDRCLEVLDRAHPDRKCWVEGAGQCAPGEFNPSWEDKVKPWQLAMFMNPVGEFNDERTIENGAPDAIGVSFMRGYADWIQDYCWQPEHQLFATGYNIGDASTWQDGAGANTIRIVDALVYAYHVTGDTRHLSHVGEAFETGIADPWYSGSGITWSNVKTQAVLARNGGAYLELIADGDIPDPSCVTIDQTNPRGGERWDPANEILLFFSESVASAGLVQHLSVESNVGGTLPALVEVVGSTARVTVGGNPANDEVITVRVDASFSADSGRGLDGNRDGTCGDAWSATFVVEREGGGDVDTAPPATVNDLDLGFDPVSGDAILHWTAPADVGPSGRPAQLEFRYQIVPQGESFDWDSAAVIEDAPAPGTPGTRQSFVVPRIDARDGALHVSMRSIDAAQNVSAPSNVDFDAEGPEVAFFDGTEIEVPEGETALVRVFLNELAHGNSSITGAYWRVDAQTAAEARYEPVVSEPGHPGIGTAYLSIDTAAWSAGESHLVRVVGEDAGGNRSKVEPQLLVYVLPSGSQTSACARVSSYAPDLSSPLKGLPFLRLVFSADIDESTVGAEDFDVALPGGGSVSPELSWLVPARVLELAFDPPLAEAGEITISIVGEILAQDGQALNEGEDCSGPTSFEFLVADSGGDDEEGNTSNLDDQDQNGRLAVVEFLLTVSEIEPGDTLRIYDLVGRQLFEQRIETDTFTVDTSTLGTFPAKLLIVDYRGHRQKVIVGGEDPYLVHLQ